VELVDGAFGFDLTVDGDAAAEVVAVALRHDVAEDRRLRCVIVNDQGRGRP